MSAMTMAGQISCATLGYGYSIGRRQKLLDEAKGDGFRLGCNSDFSPFQPCLVLDGQRGLHKSWQMAELVSVQWETRQTIPSPPPHETTAPIHPTPNACMHGLITLYGVQVQTSIFIEVACRQTAAKCACDDPDVM